MAKQSVPTKPEVLRAPSSALLLASVFAIAGCGLGYELIAGTLSAYLLGNSTTQFSVVIGVFLSAMGIGSFLSRYVRAELIRTFLLVEVAVGIIGGLSALCLFTAFAVFDNYHILLITLCIVVGTLVGLEIPLLVRILKHRLSLRSALGNVLSLDYLGALAASLVFPFVLVPHFGLVRSSALFGLVNIAVAAIGVYSFRHLIRGIRFVWGAVVVSALVLSATLVTAGATTSLLEDMLYADDVIYAKTTKYQRLVVTKWRHDVRLFIDGNIQFSSVDEFRYHESLVHPAMAQAARRQDILILGGGDGLAAKQVLKYPEVKRIDLVDLDEAMTTLFRENRMLAALSDSALSDSRVHLHHQDAWQFLETSDRVWDVILIDLPDPNNEALAKLYSRTFYRLVSRHLRPDGAAATQATSPVYATQAFWSIVATIRAADFGRQTIDGTGRGIGALQAFPYHADVPSFGDWGFVLFGHRLRNPKTILITAPTQFLTQELLPTLFVFPKDVIVTDTPVNRLDQPALHELYRSAHHAFSR